MLFRLVLLSTAMANTNICNYQQRICECDSSLSECHFTLIVEDFLSFTSYPLVESETGSLVRRLDGNSAQYFINHLGQLSPLPVNGTQMGCHIDDERFSENKCSIPMTIDSISSEQFIAVNGLIPGPTLVVNHNQTVIIEVTNMLINKEVTIHWHGQFQNNTPWMDGVDHITQCPIPTYASFQYIFKAAPSGTMWYHSHVGTQRSEGLFGALIVREDENTRQRVQNELQNIMLNENEFTIIDNPEHTLAFLDWHREDAVEVALRVIGRNSFFDKCDDSPVSDRVAEPLVRLGPDGTIISRLPITAGLINGFGKQKNIDYSYSRLSVFNVQFYNENSPVFYRFRLVGGQRHDMYNFSISDHKLTVIATDGFLTEPIEVDYVFIHAGERYDFLLKPKTEEEANGKTDYLISIYTLDADQDGNFAFLHYGNKDGNPRSTEYEMIINSTVPRNCTESSMCKALNCPFKRFALNSFIECVPVTDMKLLFPTANEELPSSNRDALNKSQYFFDFSFTGSGDSAAINGRNFAFPPASLLTQPDNPSDDGCKSGYLDCSDDRSQCICLHIINIDKPWETIQFVLTNIGGNSDKAAHPIHIHGHSFQVVGIYYGEYNASGVLIRNNQNVTCNGDPLCTNPQWTGNPVDGTVTPKTVRKDTIVVPPGGYVVLRFISDNWGFWYMHCHIEPHFLEGMAAVINEGYELQNDPPSELKGLQCGDFTWTVEEFDKSLNDPLERRDVQDPICPGINTFMISYISTYSDNTTIIYTIIIYYYVC